uniref:Uncharacterized protein n=1 Tax=Populus trichocarpa TaxID=3694 RepID=A0A2K2AVM2_POPTR
MTCEVENPLWVSLLFIDNLYEPIRKSNCSSLKKHCSFCYARITKHGELKSSPGYCTGLAIF